MSINGNANADILNDGTTRHIEDGEATPLLGNVSKIIANVVIYVNLTPYVTGSNNGPH